MKELFLIYVNFVGVNYKGKNRYEFIFSDNINDVEGEDWDLYPASNRPGPPFDKYIKKVGVLECEMLLDVIQNSDTFAVWDAIDGVIALAFENIDILETYPEKRMFFKYGEEQKLVEDKLYEKDLILKYEKDK
jgi:hypothetical protein